MERTFLHCSRSVSQSVVSHSVARPAERSFALTVRPALSSSRTPKKIPTPRRHCRCIHSSPPHHVVRSQRSRDRGPQATDDTPQTDFSALDVLRNTAAPATGIDACTNAGFALNNNVRTAGCGLLLVGGEAFRWRPWLSEHRKEGTIGGGAKGDDEMTGRLLNAKGQWEVPEEAWGLLDVVWPKPGMTPAQRLLFTWYLANWLPCRFTHHRNGTACHPYCAKCEEVFEWAGHTA